MRVYKKYKKNMKLTFNETICRNISASMSANPLVQEIQASRNKIVQYRYTIQPSQLPRSDWK